MTEEFAKMVQAGELTDVLGGLFDRTVRMVAEHHKLGEPRDHIISAEATLVGVVMAEAMRRLLATGTPPLDVYTQALTSALAAVAGEASLQGKQAVPIEMRANLLAIFDARLRGAHTLRVDR